MGPLLSLLPLLFATAITATAGVQPYAYPGAPIDLAFLERYLIYYGYMTQAEVDADRREMAAAAAAAVVAKKVVMRRSTVTEEELPPTTKRALTRLQEFAAIPRTGRLDTTTVRLLSVPRCGARDDGSPSPSAIVAPEGEFASKMRERVSSWWRGNISWLLLHDADGQPAGSRVSGGAKWVRHDARMAFEMWAAAHPKLRNLRETTLRDARPVITVRFGRRAHGDEWPFDGIGNVLGHAFFPPNSEVHMDYDEPWRVSGSHASGGMPLQPALVHEIGHALGLAHSPDDDTSVMFPYYRAGITRIPRSDVANLRVLYDDNDNDNERRDRGRNRSEKNEEDCAASNDRLFATAVRSTAVPWWWTVRFVRTLCSRQDLHDYDSRGILRGQVFLFKGAKIWLIRRDGETRRGYPLSWAQRFVDLSPRLSRVDAVYELPPAGDLVFISGTQRISLRGDSLRLRGTVDLRDLGIIGGVVHAERGESATYLFDGRGYYWRLDDTVDRAAWDYPRAIDSFDWTSVK